MVRLLIRAFHPDGANATKVAWVACCLWLFHPTGCAPTLAAAPPLPTDDAIETFIKDKMPAHLKFRCIEKKSHQASPAKSRLHVLLTVAAVESLFQDATQDAVSEAAGSTPVPANMTPPTVLKKLHGAGEIMDLPVDVEFKQEGDQWMAAAFDDKQQLASLGKPMGAFKMGAVVLGTSDARRAMQQFLKDIQKQSATKQPAAKTPAPQPKNQKTDASTPDMQKAESAPIETAPTVAAPATPTAEPTAAEPPKSDREAYKELEKVFYAVESDDDKKADEKKLQRIESKAEELLAAANNDADIKKFRQRSLADILALAQNYRDASRQAKFQDQTTTFKVQVMCDTYADAFKSLANGDINGARMPMKRAHEKRQEARASFVK
ncbi:MAG: hypothetical protein HY360_12535 [Verrucomicrobia bacterium]|nr:hypothetical protein [Verrucomicrobiota bacterium]